MKKLTSNLFGCLMVALLAVASCAVFAFLVQCLVNLLLPSDITFGQAVLIVFIISLVGVVITRKGVE